MDKRKLFTVAEAAEYCNGVVFGDGGEYITSVVIDSRNVCEGAMFVALRGEKTDGHNYIDSAIANGAVCVLSSAKPKSGSAIIVPDTLAALGQIARRFREKTNPLTIAVTGSVGKTTTKEFVASVVATKYKTQKTLGNYNSTIGLPLTLLQLREDTEAVVLEMGMSAAGEIDAMSRIASASVAVITNVGVSHMEMLGSRENIHRAKMEIVNGFGEDGVLILNGDDPMLWRQKDEKTPYVKKYTAIYNEEGDYIARNIQLGRESLCFDLYDREADKTVTALTVPAVGMHNVYNAMVSYACAKALGIDDDGVREGLMNYKTAGMRQHIYECGKYTVIADCYNAAPESMKASLATLCSLSRDSKVRSHAVLGQMRELGARSEELHRSVGETVVDLGIDYLYVWGDEAFAIADGAEEAGMSAHRIYRFGKGSTTEEMINAVISNAGEGDDVLFKASRAVRLEDAIEVFEKKVK